MRVSWIIGIILVSTLIVSGCSVDWNDEKDKKIAELETRIQSLDTWLSELKKSKSVKIPEVSFRTHIVQIGWIHSKIYDGAYWPISSIDDPSPSTDSSVQELPEGLLKIDFRGRKDFFQISCPEWFAITDCSINGQKIQSDNKQVDCAFYFSEEWKTNDLMLTCVNDKMASPL